MAAKKKEPSEEDVSKWTLNIDGDRRRYVEQLAGELGISQTDLLKAMIDAYKATRHHCKPARSVQVVNANGEIANMTFLFYMYCDTVA